MSDLSFETQATSAAETLWALSSATMNGGHAQASPYVPGTLASIDTVTRRPARAVTGMEMAPLLEAPDPSRLVSRDVMTAAVDDGSQVDAFWTAIRTSVDFAQSRAFQNGSMNLDDIIETLQKGLQFSRQAQQKEGEALNKMRLDAIQQAVKDADAGILGKIFGWIGRVFAMIALVVAAVTLSAAGQVGLAALTIVALVLTVLDFASAISQECGGPDLGLANLVATFMELGGSDKEAADAVRAWLGLAIQIVVGIVGAVGSGGASAADASAKALNIVLGLMSAANTVASVGANTVTGVARLEAAKVQIRELLGQANFEALMARAKRYADDLQTCIDDQSDWLEHYLDMLKQERKTNNIINA